MKIAITGASGFVGRRLQRAARERGHQVIAIGRSSGDRIWDPLREAAPVRDADAVIHLAGEPIAPGRWTRRKMAAIRDSRVVGTKNLVLGLQGGTCRALVTASAVGYYGDRGDETLTEESAPGQDFLSDVCVEWEARARESGVRTVRMRTATVLGPGGALRQMLPVFGLGFGGKLGSGRQWMSWIHRDDLANLYLFAVENEGLAGPIIAASPHPVRSVGFTAALGRVLDRPTWLRIPRWSMRLAMGKVASVLLASQKCLPRRALESGFQFRYPDLEQALWDAVLALESARRGRAVA
jgi:uncharacterized protein (TIGR01777 family)